MVFSNILMIKITSLFNIIHEGEIILTLCEGEEYIINNELSYDFQLKITGNQKTDVDVDESKHEPLTSDEWRRMDRYVTSYRRGKQNKCQIKNRCFFFVSKDPCTHARLSEVMGFGNKTTLSSSIHGD